MTSSDDLKTPNPNADAAGQFPPASLKSPEENPQAAVPETLPEQVAVAPVEQSTGDSTIVPESERRRQSVHEILDDPVTRHMVSASPLLKVEQTVEDALEQLRNTRELGRVVYFYVVDDDRRLVGVVPSRRLLLATPRTRVREIMSGHIVSIPSRSTVLEACEFFTFHKLLAFPVVDESGKVLGAVDVDLYTNEILEIDRRQDSEDLFQLIGVHLSEAAQKSPRLAFTSRFPWLICNLVGGMLSAFIADAYDDVATLAVVAPFIALVTALAESVSIQSVSLALQALHAQPATWGTFSKKAAFEVVVGSLLGVACGAAVGLIAYVWKGSAAVAFSLLLGIFGGVAASAVVGLSVPFVLRLIRRDLQLASGPIALALSDVVTLLFYFNLGRWVL